MMDKVYNVRIIQAVNGAIVEVGCKTFVFNDFDLLLKELHDYLYDPKATTRKWAKTFPAILSDAVDPVPRGEAVCSTIAPPSYASSGECQTDRG